MGSDDAAKACLIDGKYDIGDLVDLGDMGDLRDVFEKFTQATGLAVGFVDHPGFNVLIATGWSDICAKFHRTCPVSAANCTKSNRHMLDRLKEPRDLVIEQCDNGLVDCAVPIFVKAKHIASVVTGQILLEKPDIGRFRRQAEIFGFDVYEYLEALKDIPVVSEEKLRNATAFLGKMAYFISKLGYSNLIAKQESLRLENEIAERKLMAEEIRQTNAYLENIFENSPDVIAIVDKHGRFIKWNKMAAELYGYTFEEMQGKPAFDLYADKDELKNMLMSLRREGSVKKWEMRMKRKDGSILPFEISIGLLKDRQNETLGSVGVARDLSGIKEALAAIRASNNQLNQEIIERKRSEKALTESEEKYRILFEGSSHGILATDMETKRFVFANPSICHMLGYTENELLDLGVEDIHPKDSLKLVFSALESQLKLSSSLPCLRKDGTVFFADIAGTFTSIHGRKLAVGFFSDVTERKLAEDALRESEERFSRFFRASPVGTSISRLCDGQFTDVNDAFLGLLGYTREEVIGKNALELGIWVDPAKRQRMVRLLKEHVSLHNVVNHVRRKSGEIILVLSFVEMIEIAGDQYVLSLVYDITERKRAEEERKKLEEQLFQAQKMESVGRLAGGVAHDFNNMLGVIIGRAEIALQQDISTGKLQHHLDEILKAGLRSADLTRQLLAFARKQTAVAKILDLNDTISGMLKMLRRLIGEDIDLLWAPELDLWKVKIDPSQVDQILANLVVNARDAISGVGAVTIRTENVVIDESNRAQAAELISGNYVLLTVTDNGTGMSKEVRENIFEPFFTTKELGKGTGLGLSTVYGVVKQNDGFIYVESEPEKGTTFNIYLPRCEAETAQVPSEEAAGMRLTGTETILLVEDDESILDLSKTILENLGYTVLASRTPGHAVRLVEDHPGDIHLLMTDMVMPEMNGLELAEKLSAIRPGIKCLYMSGYTADVIAHRGILDEGVNFIQKPFGANDLAASVRQVLDRLE
ncbi:MAG: PAS domain S-box protein [Syntrophobacteraceae bacterium]